MQKNTVECAVINTELISSLRQRYFEDTQELIETQETVILNTNNIDGIFLYFMLKIYRLVNIHVLVFSIAMQYNIDL